MHFLIWETLSSNLMYVAACYLVGTGMCHNMVGLLQHYKGTQPKYFKEKNKITLFIKTSDLNIAWLFWFHTF